MKVFQAVQKGFEPIGLNPKLERFNNKMLSALAITFSGYCLLWIFLLHEADSSQEYMESIYIVTATSGLLISALSTIFMRHKLFSFIDSVDEFVNDSLNNSTSRAIYEKTNERIEKISKIGIFVMKYVIVPCFILPKAIVSFFIYFTTDLGNDAFDLPVPIWIPYDSKNPPGYLVALAAMLSLGIYPFEYMGCLMFLAFGIFMFEISFKKILKCELRSINKMARNENSRRSEMYKKFSEFIRMHASKKQLNISFSDLYEVSITIVFAGCIIAICATLLLFQIEMSQLGNDSIILLEAVVFGVWALILLLFTCELGQRFSNGVAEIDDVIIHLDWYLFPSEIQRVLPTVMQSTQKPAVVKCFGNVLCARKQFRKVAKTIYSYFMVLREFYK